MILSKLELHGNTAEKTCCSRMRRAISCVYCPPKSRTTMPPRSASGIPCAKLLIGDAIVQSLPEHRPRDRQRARRKLLASHEIYELVADDHSFHNHFACQSSRHAWLPLP